MAMKDNCNGGIGYGVDHEYLTYNAAMAHSITLSLWPGATEINADTWAIHRRHGISSFITLHSYISSV